MTGWHYLYIFGVLITAKTHTMLTTITPNTNLYARSFCDYNCIFEVEVLSRTAKTATIKADGEVKRTKIQTDRDGVEYLKPEGYSMAPIFKATKTERPN